MYTSFSATNNFFKATQTRGDLALFKKAFGKGKREKLRAGLSGLENHLVSADEILQGKEIQSRSYRGLMAVPLKKIVASESRAADFDREFHPVRKHNRQRWMRVAAGRLQGKALPAVDLIQVGDLYIVRDGHHRISVARALGEAFIDANVTLWKIKPAH